MTALKAKDIDLLAVSRKKPKKQTNTGRVVKLAALPVGLAVLFAAVFGVFTLLTHGEQVKIDAAQAYLDDPDTVSAWEEAQNLENELKQYTGRINQAEGLQKLLDSYPHLNRGMFDAVYAACGAQITIQSVNYTDTEGTLRLSAAAEVNTEAPLFIERLKATGLFTDVTYYGYIGADGTYQINASCMMKAGDME